MPVMPVPRMEKNWPRATAVKAREPVSLPPVRRWVLATDTPPDGLAPPVGQIQPVRASDLGRGKSWPCPSLPAEMRSRQLDRGAMGGGPRFKEARLGALRRPEVRGPLPHAAIAAHLVG